MGSAPGQLKLVKAGFVVLDQTAAVQKIIAFQYNPETLVRRLDASAATTSGTGVGSVSAAAHAEGAAPPAPPAPTEFVSFTLSLDAADKLERGDAVTQQNGLLPIIASLELLLYPQANSLTLWVSGNKRIVPVHINELLFNEQAFDPLLNPIRGEVSVSLKVLKDADLPPGSHGRALWDTYYLQLQQLAKMLEAVPLGALGITAV
ncbi:MAG TPA: hypothetical protein VN620_15840 [Candidatus Methylomirabilis sp.]|nr:hypothetical protein [Candidatus Methylomirabilis sp.]